MEAECPSQCSKETATCSYNEPDLSSPRPSSIGTCDHPNLTHPILSYVFHLLHIVACWLQRWYVFSPSPKIKTWMIIYCRLSVNSYL